MKRILDPKKIQEFEFYLKDEERSAATIEKYMRDVRAFASYIGETKIEKQAILDYKSKLGEAYAVASANSMIAAMNCFLCFCGWHDLCVKQFKMQRQVYCSEDKELTRAEYIRLINAANKKHNERLNLIIQTICGTGIRVSELQYITVEAVQLSEAVVNCKGKKRRIFIVPELKKKLLRYIKEQGKKVVISAPAGNDLPTIVYNVNHKTLTADDKIISAASCTTNCLAPMAKALNDYAPIQSGIMTTVHAYTGDQMILDGPQRKGDKRRSRAGAMNIVPNSTGAAKAIGLVIPELNGKLIGAAQRVPTATGSTTILIAVVKGKDVTKEGINAAMKAQATESFGYNTDEIVSSDVIGMRFGSLFDATQTMVSKIDDDTYQVQVVSWYDNENSYTSQMVRTIKYFSEI